MRINLRIYFIGVIIALLCLALFALSSYISSARTDGPQVCVQIGSGSSTSSDGSMYVKGIDYSCYPNYDGSAEWEAFNGQSYAGTFSGTSCGSNWGPTGSVYDFAYGYMKYGSSVCYIFHTTGTFSLNQIQGYTAPAHSGIITTFVGGWSGNCNKAFPSACSTTVTV